MVEGARLESVYTFKAYRGFESPSVRQIPNALEALPHYGGMSIHYTRLMTPFQPHRAKTLKR